MGWLFGAAVQFAVPEKIFGLTHFLDFFDRCTTNHPAASATGSAGRLGQTRTAGSIPQQ